MSCNDPRLRKLPNGEIITTPCGQCLACRLSTAKDWALRMAHEAQMHEDNSFITLTYANENIPEGLTLVKRDLQLFIKRLRARISPTKIRYFACGEYGAQTNRPHYHAIIFGWAWPDKEIWTTQHATTYFGHNLKGYAIYRSPLLEDLWKMGFSSIGEVNMQTCMYVGRYVQKKVTGHSAHLHYKDRQPEFALMSRRPGLGLSWLKRYWTDIYPKDFTTIAGRKYSPPRFYDTKLKTKNENLYNQIKEQRLTKIKKEDPVRRRQKEKYLEETHKRKEI